MLYLYSIPHIRSLIPSPRVNPLDNGGRNIQLYYTHSCCVPTPTPPACKCTFRGSEAITFPIPLISSFAFDWIELGYVHSSSLVVSFFLFIPPFKSVPVSLQTRAMSDKNVGANGGKVSLPEYEVKVERDVEMKTRDGVTLVSDVYR